MKSSLFLVFALSLALLGGTALAGVPDDLQQISVTIKSGEAQGSGNLVTRKIGDDTVSFVWTAAHVVDNLRTSRTVVTANGTTRTLIEYKDAEIVQERQEGGRRVGEVKFDAKVIKVSDADYGEDLALLMVRCKNAYPHHAEYEVPPGDGLHPGHRRRTGHCGSLLGQFGANSYTTGVLSQVGADVADEGRQRQGLRPGDGRGFPR